MLLLKWFNYLLFVITQYKVVLDYTIIYILLRVYHINTGVYMHRQKGDINSKKKYECTHVWMLS
jgi:hypothetical protein